MKFEPGNKAAAGKGRPKKAEDYAHIERYTKTEVLGCLTNYLRMTAGEISEVLKNPNIPAMDKWVCMIISRGAKTGDHKRLSFVLDRLIGKVKEKIEHSADESLHSMLLEQIEQHNAAKRSR